MSKSLLNLLVQISKAFVYSKIKILFGKEFFGHFRPIRPFGPGTTRFLLYSTGHFFPFPLGLSLSASPANTHGPTGRLPPPAPKQSAATVTGRAWPCNATPTSPRHGCAAPSSTPHPAPVTPPPLFIPLSKAPVKERVVSSH
jgi:hypothetical protein